MPGGASSAAPSAPLFDRPPSSRLSVKVGAAGSPPPSEDGKRAGWPRPAPPSPFFLNPPYLILASPGAGLEHLDRHEPVQAELLRPVDDAHTAAAQDRQQLV